MNEHNSNNPYSPDVNVDELCIAAMLRACADGELCPVECERLKKYLAEHPEAQAQVNFEKALRGSCDRVLSQARCPDALRNTIHAMAGAATTYEGSAQGIEASNQYTREKSFWQRSPAMTALAATLVLAAGALIWQSSSIITKGGGFGYTQTTPAAYAERVGNFVTREHMRCCDEKAASTKLIHSEINESIAYFSQRLEHPIAPPIALNDSASIRYYGGGDCSVPATDRSGHLRFDAVGPEGQLASLSLFVAPDPGLLDLEEGTTYMLDSTLCSEQGANLFAWVRDGVMYLLVSDADETMCSTVRGMMHAPVPIRKL